MEQAVDKCLALRRQGLTVKEIARVMQCHPRTVNKWLEQAPVPVIPPEAVRRVARTIDGITTGMMCRIAEALEGLEAEQAGPNRIAEIVPKLARALALLPPAFYANLGSEAPSPRREDEGFDSSDIEDFRGELLRRLTAIRESESEQ